MEKSQVIENCLNGSSIKMENVLHKIKEVLSYPILDNETVHIKVGTFLGIIISIILVTYLMKFIRALATKKLPSEDKNKFESIFGFLKYLFYVLAIVIILHTSGVDLTVLLTASAALFVGLGFALQHLFQDIISGVLIILDQSLHVGDIIEVESKVGRVFEIRLRTTRALTRDDKVLVIPNHKFLTDSIFNYTQNHKTTRESIKIGVAYGSDVDLIRDILEKVAGSQQGVLKKPKPFVLFDDFGDSALLFSLNYYITDSFSDPKRKSDMRYSIDKKFRESNISIPFPQRDIHIIQSNKA